MCVRAGAAACCGVFVRACVRACVHVLHFAPRVLLCVVRALQCVSACGACVCYGACVRRVLQCVRACMPACVCPQCVRTSFSPVPGWVDSSVGERPPAVFFAPAGRGHQAGREPEGVRSHFNFCPLHCALQVMLCLRACVCCGVCVRVRVLRCVSACVRVLRCVRTSFSFQLLPLALCPPGCCCACVCCRACVRCGACMFCCTREPAAARRRRHCDGSTARALHRVQCSQGW